MANGIKLGNLTIDSFKVGSSDCKIYLGDTLLYDGGTTPPTPTLQWVAFKDGASMTGYKIYGIKGNTDDLTYPFERKPNIEVHYDYNNNYYVVNIGNGCYTNTYGNEDIELVFSNLGCSDYYTVNGQAYNWNNIYLLIES